jgi:hypothetical protein
MPAALPATAPDGWTGGSPVAAPVPAVAAELVGPLVAVVLAVAPAVARRVPPVPAAVLGRTGTGWSGDATALGERLLGALELTVPELEVEPPPGLRERLHREVRGDAFAVVEMVGEPETAAALRRIERFAPGLRDLTAGLVAALVAEPALAPVLDPPPGTPPREEELAAARGQGHLAVAVVTALAALRATGHPMVDAGPAGVVALAVDAVVRVLPDRPVPPGYREAQLELRRARYLLPRHSSGTVPVAGHRFALAEGAFPADAPDPVNGLVAVVDGGLVLRAGTGDGDVPVVLSVLDGPAGAPDPAEWPEVVELSYEAVRGGASLLGPSGPAEPQLREVAPPWPGPVRARVCARRDGAGPERFAIALWRAAAAPEVVLADGGMLGRRRRGEPEPPARTPAATGYGWVERTIAGFASTVTVVRGLTAEEVLTAFGADPDRPAPLHELREQPGIDPWVAVLPVDGGVLAIEPNGWQGEQAPVLRLLSAADRAACVHLGGHGVLRWSFARDGAVVAAFEPLGPPEVGDAEVAAALEGIDLDDFGELQGAGYVAAARFCGWAMSERDVARIEDADVAYRILPRLPERYPEERLADGSRRWAGHGPLGADTDLLARLGDGELRDLAWWAAGSAAEHAGRADDPDVAATLAARALTPAAERAARASGLEGGSDHQMWLALHEAGGPDPLGAAVHTVDRARWVFGPAAAGFLDRVRARLP